MFHIRTTEVDPEVIVEVEKMHISTFEPKRMKGVFHRVHPKCDREVAAVLMLEHQVEKFAPHSGNGILITDKAFQKFTTSKVFRRIE